jgi:hypothetical protein
MRRYAIYAATISAAALSVYGLSSGVASASSPGAAVAVVHSNTAVHGTATKFGSKPLCGTSEGPYDSDGVTAQNGAPTNPSLNTWGGKQVKCGAKFTVHTIVVDGYPNQTANINFNIDVYKTTKKYNTVRYKKDPQPNDAKSTLCSYTDAPGTYAAAGMSTAQWTIKLPKACKISAHNAKHGVWFAIQADYDQANGQWFWATQSTATVPNEADWRDTMNLFQLGCISFAMPPSGSDVGANKDMQDCLFGSPPAGTGEPDFEMVLL